MNSNNIQDNSYNSVCNIDEGTCSISTNEPDASYNNIPFWAEDPNIILRSEFVFELFPTSSMTYTQKLNAVTRMVIALTLASLIFSRNIRILIAGAITVLSIYLLYKSNESQFKHKESGLLKEGYALDTLSPDKITSFDLNRQTGFASPVLTNYRSPAMDLLEKKGVPSPKDTFQEPSSSNPLSNVLMTDYDYNTDKKPAPPAYNANINEAVLRNAKKMVEESNPDQPDISEKLFKDLSEQMNFEQSMRPFHSCANTVIPNDQEAFSQFCYGSMTSAKESNLFALSRNLARHTLY
jgi:hypothetical protein